MSNPQVTHLVILEGEGHQTIHVVSTAFGHTHACALWLLEQHLIIIAFLDFLTSLNQDTLRKAEFAPVSQVDEARAYMLLSWVVVTQHLLPAALPSRGRAMHVASAGHVAGIEVPKGVRVLGDPDQGSQFWFIVSTVGEGQRPLTEIFPHRHARFEAECDRSFCFILLLGADKDGSMSIAIGVHGVGVDVQPREWRHW